MSFDLEVVVHLLEDEEGVRHADGSLEEPSRRLDACRWVLIDEAGQRSFELLVWVCCELTVSDAAGRMKSQRRRSPLLASGASFLK